MKHPWVSSIHQRFLTFAGRNRQLSDDPASSTAEPELVWFNRFQAIFAAIACLSLIFALSDTSAPIGQRLLSVPILGLIVFLYMRLIVGRDARETRDASLYVAGAVPSLLALILLHPAFYLLTFAAYWQVFTFLSIRRAMTIASVLTVMLISLDSDDGLRLPLTSVSDWIVFGFNIILGGMMALFIRSLFVQGERRQQLIEELNATRAQLAVQERTAGILEERHRIAGDFHDTVAQDLASVVMQLEAAEARLSSPEAESVRTHIRLARDTARSGLTEARRIVHALVPDVLSAHSIVDAMRITSSRWSKATHTPCAFEVVGDPPQLDRSADVVLLRSLQEALTNVRKHTNASSVVVTLTNLGDEVALDVHDSGQGFDPAALAEPSPADALAGGRSGMGLVAMRERVQSIGGRTTIESEPGAGTTVSIALPVSSGTHDGVNRPLEKSVKETARV